MSEVKAKDLKQIADEIGFVPLFCTLGSDIRVRIPLSLKFCEQSIDYLDLSVRSKNCMMRVDARTVNGIVDKIMSEEGLASIRNLGKKSINEIKTILLLRGYEELTDAEKLDFWEYVIEENNFVSN